MATIPLFEIIVFIIIVIFIFVFRGVLPIVSLLVVFILLILIIFVITGVLFFEVQIHFILRLSRKQPAKQK
jgi:hypothetical protein